MNKIFLPQIMYQLASMVVVMVTVHVNSSYAMDFNGLPVVPSASLNSTAVDPKLSETLTEAYNNNEPHDKKAIAAFVSSAPLDTAAEDAKLLEILTESYKNNEPDIFVNFCHGAIDTPHKKAIAAFGSWLKDNKIINKNHAQFRKKCGELIGRVDEPTKQQYKSLGLFTFFKGTTLSNEGNDDTPFAIDFNEVTLPPAWRRYPLLTCSAVGLVVGAGLLYWYKKYLPKLKKANTIGSKKNSVRSV